MSHIITEQILDEYRKYLIDEEKNIATINKYTCDIKKTYGLCQWTGNYKKADD